MRKAIELGLLNTLSYVILSIDLRSVSQANYPVAFWVNVFIAFLTVTILKRVVAARTWSETLAYMASGGVGTVIGIYLSQHYILGK